MEKIKKWFSEFVFDMSSDQASPEEIHDTVISGIRLKGSQAIVLFCAIIIASVGLNTNSGAVVIGAMLISPLMGSIIAISYGIAIYDPDLIKKASFSFAVQILIALVASILYFSITPNSTATQELINRTNPSFFDFLIAFFGGSAGIVASTRKEKTNVIPGVAIATALMPPLCTVGYGIANGNPAFIFGPAYLFGINTFFIILSTLFFCTFIKLKKTEILTKAHSIYLKKIVISGLMTISIPLLISAIVTSYESLILERVSSNLDLYIAEEINRQADNNLGKNTNVIIKEIDIEKQAIKIYLLGDTYSADELKEIRLKRDDYNLGDYSINISQGAEEALYRYFINIES